MADSWNGRRDRCGIFWEVVATTTKMMEKQNEGLNGNRLSVCRLIVRVVNESFLSAYSPHLQTQLPTTRRQSSDVRTWPPPAGREVRREKSTLASDWAGVESCAGRACYADREWDVLCQNQDVLKV